MHEGFFTIHRRIWHNPVACKPNYIAVWVYILSKTNHTPKDIILNDKKTTIPRGSYLGSISKIAKQFNLSRSTVKKIIDYFEGDGMLYTSRTRNYTVFQVLNYDKYQGCVHEANTRRTPTVQRGATTNNVNNENNANKEVYDQNFLDVWDVWPKLRKGSKEKSFSAYRSALKRDTIENINNGVQKYIDSEESKGQYAKGCAAWFNDDRWNNNYTTKGTLNGKSNTKERLARETFDLLDKIGSAGGGEDAFNAN